MKRQANPKNANRNDVKGAYSSLARRPGRSPWPACVGLLVPLAALGQAAGGKSTTLVNQWLREQSPVWNAWDIGGEFRTRVDSYHNSSPASATRHFQKSGVDNDDTLILTREKLHLGYQRGWLQVYAELRNSNSSGEDQAGRPNEDRLDLQQAYVSLGNLTQFPFQVQAGRMQLLYGDERVIGPSDWSNVTRSFDAVRLRFQQSPLWADAFVSRVVVPKDGKFNQSNEKDHFWGLYGGVKKLLPWQDLEVYFLGRNTDAPNRANTSSRDIYTVGFRATSPKNSLGNWDYTVEALHQFGNITQAGRQLAQDAWATSLAAGYTWKDIWGSPRLGFEYNFSTGDSDPNDDKNETIDILFPTNHSKYGLMDVTGWRNIHNPIARLKLKPADTLTVGVDYHLFWLADTADFFYPQSGSGRNGLGYGRNPSYDNFLGSELDVDVIWSAHRCVNLRAGYSHFFAGDYIKQSKQALGGATDADWAYVQVTAVF